MQSGLWQTVGKVRGNPAAKALNAGNRPVQHSHRLGRIHHGQSMVILHTPDVNHIRLIGFQFLLKSLRQLRPVEMSRGLRHGSVAAKCVQLPRLSAAPVQNPHGHILMAQIGQHMIHPVNLSRFLAGEGRPDETGGIVAQPEQLHGLFSFFRFFFPERASFQVYSRRIVR